jgi:hypothetical protein
MGKERHASDYTAWWVESECGWTSPKCDDRQRAIKAWNTRAEQPEQGEYVKLGEIQKLLHYFLERGFISLVRSEEFLDGLKTRTIPEKLSAMYVVDRIRKVSNGKIPPELINSQLGAELLNIHIELNRIEEEIGGEG